MIAPFSVRSISSASIRSVDPANPSARKHAVKKESVIEEAINIKQAPDLKGSKKAPTSYFPMKAELGAVSPPSAAFARLQMRLCFPNNYGLIFY
jgi:hypothetical protein